VEAFWAGDMDPAEQEVFLQENRVGYVLVGPRELEIGGWRMENGEWRMENGELGGEPVFETSGVKVYEVNGR